jgi:hypothetical protein
MKIREVEPDGSLVDIHNDVVAPIQMPGGTFIKKSTKLSYLFLFFFYF